MFPFQVNFSNWYFNEFLLVPDIWSQVSVVQVVGLQHQTISSQILVLLNIDPLEPPGIVKQNSIVSIIRPNLLYGICTLQVFYLSTAFWGGRISTSSPTSNCRSLAFLSCMVFIFYLYSSSFFIASLDICSMLLTKSTRYRPMDFGTIVDPVHCSFIVARGVLIFLPNIRVNAVALQGVLRYSSSINSNCEIPLIMEFRFCSIQHPLHCSVEPSYDPICLRVEGCSSLHSSNPQGLAQ